MGRQRKVSVKTWDALAKEATCKEISKDYIRKKLKTSPESFKRYVSKTSTGKNVLYTIRPGFYKLAETPLEHEVVDKRLTSITKGFIVNRKKNQDELFITLGLTSEDRIKRILKDPIYEMAVKELGKKLSNIGKFTLVGHSNKPQQSTQAVQ